MKTDELREDEGVGTLAGLTTHDVDRARADSIRARCHQALGGRRHLATRMPDVGPFYRWALEPALVALLSAVYLSEVLLRAMALYGF